MKYQEFFCGKIFTSCSLCTKSLFKNDFDQNVFYLSTDFKKMLLHILRQTKCSIIIMPRNILSRFNQLQNICDNPLSDPRKRT